MENWIDGEGGGEDDWCCSIFGFVIVGWWMRVDEG